ncbi:MAG: hypothetical protein WCO45_17275 [Pseudanabaena sp. ELA607]|jgi:transcription elongation factor Elf1
MDYQIVVGKFNCKNCDFSKTGNITIDKLQRWFKCPKCGQSAQITVDLNHDFNLNLNKSNYPAHETKINVTSSAYQLAIVQQLAELTKVLQNLSTHVDHLNHKLDNFLNESNQHKLATKHFHDQDLDVRDNSAITNNHHYSALGDAQINFDLISDVDVDLSRNVSLSLANPKEIAQQKFDENKHIETVFRVNDNREIQEFLNSKEIKIRNLPETHEHDEILDRIAILIGVRYPLVRKFHEKVKGTMNHGEPFTLNLKNDTQEAIASICQIANFLYKIAFLEEYNYQKSPRFILSARVNRIPQAINFFSGAWLERFIRKQIIAVITEINPEINYSFLINPQVILPNGNNFEMDLFFKVEEEIFWFEVKSGEYQKYVNKYAKIKPLLGLDKEHSYLILLEAKELSTQALSSLFDMTVTSLEIFTLTFSQAVEKYRINRE